ncbi:hypothetical protein ABTP08_20910, partial [Acinetobacter baumannii]
LLLAHAGPADVARECPVAEQKPTSMGRLFGVRETCEQVVSHGQRSDHRLCKFVRVRRRSFMFVAEFLWGK